MSLKNLKKYQAVPVDVNHKTKPKAKKAYKGKTSNARHMAEDPDWITSPDILNVERLMWAQLNLEIDLDPYSCARANEVVRAKRFFTEQDDGFAQPHVGEAVHVNHPGGTTKRAWKKFVDELRLGNTKRACWVGFSVEQPCILAEPLEGPRAVRDPYPHPMDFSYVTLRSRIDFLKEETLEPGGRPGHGNYLVICGVWRDVVDWFWRPMGRVHHGVLGGLEGDDFRKALAAWKG